MGYILFIFSLIAYAENEIPKWVTSPATSDALYYYGFGMAESESESLAFSEADKNAESDLIQNAFGASFQVSTQMNSDNMSVNLKKTLLSESNQVLTRNVERAKIFKERPIGSGYKIFVLKRINKKIADEFTFQKVQSLSKSHFESNPSGASVTVDGKPLGITPLTALLPSGNYSITMKLNGYKSISRNLIIGSKSESTMTMDFEKQTGSVHFDVEPSNASILLDGDELDPSRKTFDLSPGVYTIKVLADGYVPKEQSIQIETDKQLTLAVQLAKIKGSRQRRGTQDIDLFNKRAQKLYANGKYAEVIKLANSQAPNSWIKAFYVAIAYSELAMHDYAIENIDYASKQFKEATFLTAHCKILSAAGKYEEALSKCDEAILADPTIIEPYVIKARVCFDSAEKYPIKRSEYVAKGVEFYLAASKLDSRYRNELLKICRRNPFHYYTPCERYKTL